MNIALCFCVRNCEPYLNYIFNNINRLKTNNITIFSIFIYDNCTDNTNNILKYYQSKNKNVIIRNIKNTSKYRTVRIATARNECLNIVYNELNNIHYHIAIDCDSVNIMPWNVNLIHSYLNNFDNDDWDSISFNRPDFYDIWALLFDNYKHHCWGFGNDSPTIVINMKKDIINKIKHSTSNSIDVLSAFNGFCIYKTKQFKNCYYDGLYSNVKQLITPEERIQTLNYIKQYNINASINDKCIECCEHIFYHLLAIKQGCKNKISKYNLFIHQTYIEEPPLYVQSKIDMKYIVFNKSNKKLI
jgi:hypothetical protein